MAERSPLYCFPQHLNNFALFHPLEAKVYKNKYINIKDYNLKGNKCVMMCLFVHMRLPKPLLNGHISGNLAAVRDINEAKL